MKLRPLSDRFHLEASTFWADVGLTVVFACITLYVERFLHQTAFRLPLYEEVYRSDAMWSVFALFGKRLWIYWTLLLGGCLAVQYFERLTWRDLHPFSRWLFMTAVVVQTYSMATIDFNHYFEEWYAWDRLLIIAFGVLVAYRPVFTPIFVFQMLLMTGQHRIPDFIGYDHVHKFIAAPVLIYVWASLILGQFLRVRAAKVLPGMFVISVLALWYIFAGIGKFEIGWQNQNSLYNLFAAATDVGWLEGWSRATKIKLGDFLIATQPVFLWATLVVEIMLPVLLFFSWRTAFWGAVSLFAFHLSVYLFSGILFWQWSAYEVVFIAYLVFARKQRQALFNRSTQVAYAVLLLLIPFFTHIGRLAWLDCGYINKYTFFLVDATNNRKQLDATYFSPYDTGFAKNRFYFLTQYRTLANTYGQCNDTELMKIVNNESGFSAENLLTATERLRPTAYERFDPAKGTAFTDFLTTFVKNKNAYDPKWISLISPPPHMQQGEDQRNLTVDNLTGLEIVYTEKIALPGLEYLPVRSDTILIPLSTFR